ncbi:ABC transporter substrate-binding protein, partial [Vibrio rotiferianus]
MITTIKKRAFLRRILTACTLLAVSTSTFAEKLNIGITLQPYYSYVKAVVGDKAEIIPLVDAGF